MHTSSHLRLPAPRVTALFVSPSNVDHAALRKILSRSNWVLHSAFTCKEALALLSQESISVVLCDCNLPDWNWRFLLEKTARMQLAPKVIVSAREVDEHLWADVLQVGGYDLLAMPWDSHEVLKVVSLAWRSWDFACRTKHAKGKGATPQLAAAGAAAG
jgi:DNA-binding NtrC family response regulator